MGDQEEVWGNARDLCAALDPVSTPIAAKRGASECLCTEAISSRFRHHAERGHKRQTTCQSAVRLEHRLGGLLSDYPLWTSSGALPFEALQLVARDCNRAGTDRVLPGTSADRLSN